LRFGTINFQSIWRECLELKSPTRDGSEHLASQGLSKSTNVSSMSPEQNLEKYVTSLFRKTDTNSTCWACL
jgi:hypothetical protein